VLPAGNPAEVTFPPIIPHLLCIQLPCRPIQLPGIGDADAGERFKGRSVAVDADTAAAAVDDVDAVVQVRDAANTVSAFHDALQSPRQRPVSPVRLTVSCTPTDRTKRECFHEQKNGGSAAPETFKIKRT